MYPSHGVTPLSLGGPKNAEIRYFRGDLFFFIFSGETWLLGGPRPYKDNLGGTYTYFCAPLLYISSLLHSCLLIALKPLTALCCQIP